VQILRNRLFRALLAFTVVTAAALSAPSTAQASACQDWCIDSCSSHGTPFEACQFLDGGTCGLGASCTSDFWNCGTWYKLTCIGGEQ